MARIEYVSDHSGNYKTPSGDLIGQRYGQLTVVGKTRLKYIMQCDCGKVREVNRCHVGRNDSCMSCYRKMLKANKMKYTRSVGS